MRSVASSDLRAGPRASLAVLPRKDGARVVWRVTLPSRVPLATYEVLVDARDGQVLRVRDVLRRAFVASADATVFDTNPVVAHGSRTGLADNGDGDSAALTALLESVTLHRLDDGLLGCLSGRWVHATLPSGEVCDPLRDFTDLMRSDDAFEAVMAYFHADRAQSYVQSLGFTDVLNRQLEVHADEVFDDGEEDNSFYDPSTGDISLGTGNVDDGEDGEVIVHEYGHAIQDDQVPGFGLSEQGAAMGEGFGDYLAAAISERFVSPARPELDPCIAEWDEVGFEDAFGIEPAGVPCLRRTDRDLTASEVGSDSDCEGEPHCAGEAWSAALWDIRAQIGATAADRLVIQSHFSLTPSSGFHEGSLALLAADNALYGGTHTGFIRDLLLARELFDAERLDDTIPTARPLTTPFRVTGRLDAAGDSHDVFAVPMTAGRPVLVKLTGTPVPGDTEGVGSPGEIDLRVFHPGATSIEDKAGLVAVSETTGLNETISLLPGETGVHYIDVLAVDGFGTYTLEVSPDRDRDSIADAADNCPAIVNTAQSDRDGDALGDPCDPLPDDPGSDLDGDGLGARDNCPRAANRTQLDWDRDGRGDLCDRSARLRLDLVRISPRRLVLRAHVKPVRLGRRAVRLEIRRRACTQRCRFKVVHPPTRVRGAKGRVTYSIRLARGRYRVSARLVDRRYARSRSRVLAIGTR